MKHQNISEYLKHKSIDEKLALKVYRLCDYLLSERGSIEHLGTRGRQWIMDANTTAIFNPLTEAQNNFRRRMALVIIEDLKEHGVISPTPSQISDFFESVDGCSLFVEELESRSEIPKRAELKCKFELFFFNLKSRNYFSFSFKSQIFHVYLCTIA